FLDNISIKGLTLIYNNIKKIFRVYYFILKYLINLNKVFINIKLFSYIILKPKLKFY
ncbi:hypothetical protein B0I35DRAFT_361180, partial [Stachybotrys elegans]